MAVLVAENPRLVGGPVMATVKKLILNGQAWKAGEFLNIDANSLLKECASDDDAATGGIKYQALTNQTDPGNSTTEAEVGVIVSDHIFEGNDLDGQAADAHVGEQVGIDVTSNVCTVDLGDVTNPAVVITDRGPQFSPAEYDATDTLAKLRFKVLTVAIEATPA